MELFRNYARKMTNIEDEDSEVIVRSILHGNMRVLTAQLRIEEMFRDKRSF